MLHLQAKPSLDKHSDGLFELDREKNQRGDGRPSVNLFSAQTEWVFWHVCQAVHVMASASGRRIMKKCSTSSVLVYKKYYSNDQVSILTFSVCCHAAPTANQLVLPMAFLIQYEWNICEMERATKASMHAKYWVLAYPDFCLFFFFTIKWKRKKTMSPYNLILLFKHSWKDDKLKRKGSLSTTAATKIYGAVLRLWLLSRLHQKNNILILIGSWDISDRGEMENP